jgi:phosphoglycolate phosphatase-like HAD superfamily hydrolase
MIEKHRLNPRQCHMIGDSRSDVLAGINAGINAVAVTTGIDHGAEGIPEVADGRAKQYASLAEFVAGLESEEDRH